MKRLAVVAVLCCLSIPALAQPAGAPTPALDQGAVPAAPVVYLVQQPAAAPGGVGAIPWEVWGTVLGLIVSVVFMFWRGQTADRARALALQLAEGAWYVAERQGGTGAQKFAAAADAFAKAMSGAGFKVDQRVAEVRDAVFAGMSAADAVARERAALAAAPGTAPAVDPSQPLAAG